MSNIINEIKLLPTDIQNIITNYQEKPCTIYIIFCIVVNDTRVYKEIFIDFVEIDNYIVRIRNFLSLYSNNIISCNIDNIKNIIKDILTSTIYVNMVKFYYLSIRKYNSYNKDFFKNLLDKNLSNIQHLNKYFSHCLFYCLEYPREFICNDTVELLNTYLEQQSNFIM